MRKEYIIAISLFVTLVLIGYVATQGNQDKLPISPVPTQDVVGSTNCHILNGEFDPSCNHVVIDPTVTQANIQEAICRSGYSASVRPPESYTYPIKIQSMAAYEESGSSTKSIELDHIEPIETGGSPTDPYNLFPEPNHYNLNGYDAGSLVKDQLENVIHEKICSGAISLQEGQDAFKDWISSYRLYIGQLPFYTN